MNGIIGEPLDRVDGPLKVTGRARYSAEFQLKNLAQGVCVGSTITRGRIRTLNTSDAEAAPGVIAVLTHKNAPGLKHARDQGPSGGSMVGEVDLVPLQSDKIYYDGQYIAVVVAGTLEEAQYAATLIKVDYEEQQPVLTINQSLPQAYQPKQAFGRELQTTRGEPDQAFSDAAIKLVQTYSTPVEHHNPIELQACIAEWQGDRLTLYDSTQWIMGTRNGVADFLGMPRENVRVISHFLGGGFGCKGSLWPHSVLAAVAARHTGRPVKLVLTRQQMFTCTGHRGWTIQQIFLGATNEGKLTAVRHLTTTETSMVGEFIETAGLFSKLLYATPNLEVGHRVVRLNQGTPAQMRAPGHAPGTYAFEAAMDELAYQLNMDPIELRLANYAESSPKDGKPWSGKHLKECYRRGAEAIGWAKRTPEPRSMREGDYLVGYGMATAIYPCNRSPSSAKVQIFADGRAVAASSTQELGTGTYTIMTQIAAEALGMPVERVEFRLGDSLFPEAPVSGGSQTAASVGPPVRAAARNARSKVVLLAMADKASPLYGQPEEGIAVEDGRLFLISDPGRGETYGQVLTRRGLPMVEAEARTEFSTRETRSHEGNPAVPANALKATGSSSGRPDETAGQAGRDSELYAFQSFGAQFVKVRVDPVVGTVRAARCVSVMDIGRVLNQKTARNQIMGGVIFGLGMALLEETVYDPNRGRIVTRDLANYHLPVNADVPDIDVQFIGEPDPHISSIGARGIGEIGTTGTAAAIANAVYHATGKRIRDLPITPEKLL